MRTIISKSVRTPARSPAFADQLPVAVGIGHRAGLLIEIGRGQHHVGERRGLGHEHLLHDEKGIFERLAADAIAGDRIRTDDIERGQLTAARGIEHLDEIHPRSLRQGASVLLGKGSSVF